MKNIIALLTIVCINGCASLTTPQACHDANARLAGAQAAIPILQAAVTTQCQDKTSKLCTDAETAFNIGEALVVARQADVAAECSNVITGK